MPYNSHFDKFYPVETSPTKEKEIMNAANALWNAKMTVNEYFTQTIIGNISLDAVVFTCLTLTQDYWQTAEAIETAIRRDTIKKHISLRLKMWIDAKEF